MPNNENADDLPPKYRSRSYVRISLGGDEDKTISFLVAPERYF